MYTCRNFKTKTEFKKAVASYVAGTGKPVMIFDSGPFGHNPTEGTVSIEGPHYPEPHRWYARATLSNGVVVKVS